MPLEALGTVPRWLVVGAGLGVLSTLVVAGLFLAGERLFPTTSPPDRERGRGDDRRRAEIRLYLRSIGEPFAEDHHVDGQPVDFYLPERDVAVTFDPRAYYRIERSRTEAVLVEHELPGAHLGARLPFETPEHGEADVDVAATAFAALGLPTSATHGEVKRAYREKVKEVHPDHGGDSEAFRRLREAYTTASKQAS